MGIFSTGFAALTLLGLILLKLFPAKWRWLVLLGLSWGFYAFCGLGPFAVLLAVTGLGYAAGRRLSALNERLAALDKGDKPQTEALRGRKKRTLALALVLLFGALFAFKYLSGLTAGLDRLLGLGWSLPALFVPLGLSYYCFQSAGYMIDCYRGGVTAERSFPRYALFVAFFPQLTEGPIGRYGDLAPQLADPKPLTWESAKTGLQLILWGALKKLVIADRAAVVVSEIYGNYTAYGGVMIAVGVLFYCIQLYCDFSGTIDVVRGVAYLLGVELAENFRRPIFAVSLTDYWRRWHISLGAWLRDYMFYPISLSRWYQKISRRLRKRLGGRFGKILPTSLVTFLIYFVIGVWHGSSLKYLAFGVYNGVIITAGLLAEPLFEKFCVSRGIDRKSRDMRAFGMLRTTCIVFVGRYLTRAGSLRAALAMLWKTVRHPIPSQFSSGALFRLGLTGLDLALIGCGVLAVLFVEARTERGDDLDGALERRRGLRTLLTFLALAVLLLFGVFRGSYIPTEMIYQQF